MQNGILRTVDVFHEDNPLDKLVPRLQGGGFGRGLPTTAELSRDPSVVAFFQTLIRDGEVEEGVENSEVIKKCHKNGWIHACETSTNPPTTYYIIPSPLHSSTISWTIAPSDDMPSYPSILELCEVVISKFKPSQMDIPVRRVGTPSTNDQLPEAQYQDEFYRSMFAITGNVRISPEFAAAKKASVPGFIDFFIAKPGWGIEVLQDGDRLQELSLRFDLLEGAYGPGGAWLTPGVMKDYIILDCCTSVPQKAHPSTVFDFWAKFLC